MGGPQWESMLSGSPSKVYTRSHRIKQTHLSKCHAPSMSGSSGEENLSGCHAPSTSGSSGKENVSVGGNSTIRVGLLIFRFFLQF